MKLQSVAVLAVLITAKCLVPLHVFAGAADHKLVAGSVVPATKQAVPLRAPASVPSLEEKTEAVAGSAEQGVPSLVAFKVFGVSEEKSLYVAAIEYEGRTYVVQRGTHVPDDQNPAFDVRQVSADRVEVFDRRSFRIVQQPLEKP